ncbi:recombinase family protein [Polycladidibacter stylochi]|uniref:recombinase family protein n=1 Tax=Polycladidibacter stylochi TaxID=1807766 RepID=UPI0009E96865|nr:recombinase family protein [Pseudovibrio stylochi]
MKIGYARVSTLEQNLRLQIDALKKAGCDKIYADTGVKGNAVIKPQLEELLNYAREGDTLVIWKLDRLSRSLPDLIACVRGIEKRGLEFQSLTEKLETGSPAGRLFFHVMGSLAEFERDIIEQRTREGMQAAKAAGVKMGRPNKLKDEQWQNILEMKSKGVPIAKIASVSGMTRQAIYYRLRQLQDAESNAIEVEDHAKSDNQIDLEEYLGSTNQC